jgi:aspartate aminotransferase
MSSSSSSSAAAVASSGSWWKDVQPAARDPILGVTEAFLADTHPSKMNVGVGAYRTDEGKPLVLECVRQAERRIAGSNFMEYLPMGGSVVFNDHSMKLAYGEEASVLADKRVAGIQALSGTGACRLFADFQRRFKPESHIFIPVPTWAKYASSDDLHSLHVVPS